jgi:hypothetical protein
MVDNEVNRVNFKRWLDENDLSAFAAAKKAEVSPGAIYNFLNGTSKSLSSLVLQKLADGHGTTVDDILTGGLSHDDRSVIVSYRIGAGGSMFDIEDHEETVRLARPVGLSSELTLAAAVIDGDGLAPIPEGWAVFFEADTTRPEDLLGALAVVRWSGGGDRPVVRTIRKGSETGMYSLQAFSGALLENVEIRAAHRVVSFAEPTRV